MRARVSLILLAPSALLFVSCGGTSGISSAGASNPGYGPFDRNGNYVEAWADRPAKKHWWARKPQEAPAKEEPRIAAVPKKTEKTKPAATPLRPTEVASLSRQSTYTPPKPAPRPTSTYTPPKPKPVAYTPPPKPKPKPKPTPVKPKAPPPARHLVVKGDTLYNISRRYGASISSIQRANGIKGTTIRLGQTLLIPRT